MTDEFVMQYSSSSRHGPLTVKITYNRPASTFVRQSWVRDVTGKSHQWAVARYRKVTDETIHAIARKSSTFGFLEDYGCPITIQLSDWAKVQRRKPYP